MQDAFAQSVAVIWQTMIGISGAAFLASLFMKGLPLHTQVDENWGLEDDDGAGAAAAAGRATAVELKACVAEESVLPEF